MYSSELIKISEAYTKQMYKVNITESTVTESTQRVAECGKQCNESYEEFYVKLEKEPFNILEDDCWQCDELLTLVRNNDKEEEFNALAKETFMDNAPTITEFNDWCRFDYDSICEYLGLSDDEDEEDELDESGTDGKGGATAGAAAPTAGKGAPTDGKGGATAGAAAPTAGKGAPTDGKGAPTDGKGAPTDGKGGATQPNAGKGWWDTTVDTVDRKYKELEDWAKKNPGLAMGAAAGVAGLGTALLARKRRRR
jgi:hypothetical protein